MPLKKPYIHLKKTTVLDKKNSEKTKPFFIIAKYFNETSLA